MGDATRRRQERHDVARRRRWRRGDDREGEARRDVDGRDAVRRDGDGADAMRCDGTPEARRRRGEARCGTSTIQRRGGDRRGEVRYDPATGDRGWAARVARCVANKRRVLKVGFS